MTDFLELDFCKTRSLRVARRFDVSDGITSEQLAGATSLGCNFPISHRASAAPGFILSRINKQSGKDVRDLLESANESDLSNPGPSAWLSALPDRIITGSVALPFPAARPVVTPRLFANGNEVSLAHQTVGLGGSTGFRTTVVVPPENREYIDPGPLANHDTKWYYGCVSSPNSTEAYRLVYNNANTVTGVRAVYLWPGVAGQGTTVTQNAPGNWQHIIGVGIVGIPPAIIGYASLVKTPPVEFNSAPMPGPTGVNGPEQTARKFSYPLVGTLTNPDFGGTANPSFNLANTRPTLTIFSQSEFAENFGGYDIFTINGQSISFASTSLPFDQYATPPFGSGGNPTDNFFNSGTFVISEEPAIQGMLHGRPNQAAQMEIPLPVTSLNFQIRTADNPSGPISTFTINIPKPANMLAWMECTVFVWSRHVGPL